MSPFDQSCGDPVIGLICPDCGEPIAGSRCRCGRVVSTLRGMPDLRVVEDPYLSSEEDFRIARRLDEVFDRSTFRELLELYLEWAGVPLRARAGQIAHILGADGRAAAWLRLLPSEGPILELGCGSGAFLKAIGSTREVVGCDIAMRWLMIARKQLDEAGLHRIPLVRASSEKLPWPDDSFVGIVAGDVIEHVADQARTIEEAHRLLKPGGVLVMTTPNRYSLGPEPHVGLLGLGYLPRAWMPRYCALRGRGDYRAIRNNGGREWERILAASPFREYRVETPRIEDADLRLMPLLKRPAAQLYNQFAGSRLARLIGPTFRIVCRKAGPDLPRGSKP